MPDAGAPEPAGPAAPALDPAAVAIQDARDAVIFRNAADTREKFLPVTRYALIDRLAREQAWPAGDAAHARRFFRYLDYWRQQSYVARLLELEQNYEPFSPDSDLLVTRKFSAPEQAQMQKGLIAGMQKLLVQANFRRIDPADVDLILTKDSFYGLDLHVDLAAFEEILIYYRGAVTRTERRRSKKRLYLMKEQYEVPIFQRLFLLFKLKPVELRVREVMSAERCTRKEAERIVKRRQSALPAQVKSDYVYMKLFKNIPRSDLEMVFPNTQVRFRMFDKLKFGVTAGSGLGAGVFGTAGKLAVASNPFALAGAVGGLGLVALRQGTNFINQRNRYMVTMAQNLYFHSMADNRGVMTLLADRAAEEDVKEEVLLYAVLAKETVNLRDIGEVDSAIEQYLLNHFGLNVNFDVDDALERLLADGIVEQQADGSLVTKRPHEAALHIDKLWDSYLDNLPDPKPGAGHEFDGDTGAVVDA